MNFTIPYLDTLALSRPCAYVTILPYIGPYLSTVYHLLARFHWTDSIVMKAILLSPFAYMAFAIALAIQLRFLIGVFELFAWIIAPDWFKRTFPPHTRTLRRQLIDFFWLVLRIMWVTCPLIGEWELERERAMLARQMEEEKNAKWTGKPIPAEFQVKRSATGHSATRTPGPKPEPKPRPGTYPSSFFELYPVRFVSSTLRRHSPRPQSGSVSTVSTSSPVPVTSSKIVASDSTTSTSTLLTTPSTGQKEYKAAMLDYHRSLSTKDVRPTTIAASSSICFPSRTLAPSPIPEQSPELVARSPHTLAPSPILEQLPEPLVHSSQILAPVPEHWPRYVPPRRSMIISPRYVEWAPGISIRESVPPFTLPDPELSP